MSKDPRTPQDPTRDGKRGYYAKRATLARKQQRAAKRARREGK